MQQNPVVNQPPKALPKAADPQTKVGQQQSQEAINNQQPQQKEVLPRDPAPASGRNPPKKIVPGKTSVLKNHPIQENNNNFCSNDESPAVKQSSCCGNEQCSIF
mmetsp:Transcript_14670/g.24991  ORF Transcript_14670/g.24991 Transcript_14670/m.24991 type:complete len:104 (+) Transcript_14670:712-1023(+)